MGIRLLELLPSVTRFDHLLEETRALYEVSFPPQERRPFEEITSLLGTDSEDRARILVAVEGNEVLGLSIFRYIPSVRIGYLWYLCVSESARGRQVGTSLYRASVNRLVEAGARALVFEVEPLSARVPPVYGDPLRRIRFYERLGARPVIGYEYVQPPIPPYGPVRLELMVHLLDGRSDCPGWELAEIIDGWLSSLGRVHEEVPPSVRLGSIADLVAREKDQGLGQ